MSPSPFVRLPGVQSDQRLIDAARAGDERAFETLVRRHRRSLLRYCRRMGLSDSRAEDVVQQALLRAWLALDRGREVHAPKAWLYRTVHNTAVNVIHSSRDDHAPLEDGARADSLGSAESDFERRLAVRETLSDVAALPHMQREAILLTAFDGRSHEEVASALGVTHGAVRGLLYRARATLRDAAAAVLPAPFLAWAGACVARLAPTGSRIAEVAAPTANADMGGALTKGVALAATAAAIAVGTGAVPLEHHIGKRPKTPVVALGIGAAGAEAQTSERSSTVAAPELGAQAGSSRHHAGSALPGRERPSAPSHRGVHRAGAKGEQDLVHGEPHQGGREGSASDGRAILGGEGAPTAGPGHDGISRPESSGSDHPRGGHPGSDGSPAKAVEQAPEPEPEPAPTRREADHRAKAPEAAAAEPHD